MKKTTNFSLFAFILFLFLVPNISHSAFIFQTEESSIELSYKRFNFEVNESTATSPDMRDTGILDGVRLAYSHSNKETQIFYKLILEHMESNYSNFEGVNMLSDAQGLTYEKMTVKNSFRTIEGNFGLLFKRGANKLPFDLILYTGFGYHYWKREFQGNVRFNQEYSWQYIPVGFKMEYSLTPKLSVALDVAAKLTTKARLHANLRDAKGGGITVKTNPGSDLGRKVGGRVEVPFIYRSSSTKGWSYILTPWIDITQTIEKDSADFYVEGVGPVSWVEPALEVVKTGVTIGLFREF